MEPGGSVDETHPGLSSTQLVTYAYKCLHDEPGPG